MNFINDFGISVFGHSDFSSFIIVILKILAIVLPLLISVAYLTLAERPWHPVMNRVANGQ